MTKVIFDEVENPVVILSEAKNLVFSYGARPFAEPVLSRFFTEFILRRLKPRLFASLRVTASKDHAPFRMTAKGSEPALSLSKG
jgi:hypothetical protein